MGVVPEPKEDGTKVYYRRPKKKELVEGAENREATTSDMETGRKNEELAEGNWGEAVWVVLSVPVYLGRIFLRISSNLSSHNGGATIE